jgi:bifunctional non-homologous end joining protein LigD
MPRGSKTVSRKRAASAAEDTQPVVVTHSDRMMFPEAGIAKGDLFAFYEKVAPLLLPHLRDRPMTLERLPEGLSSKDAPHFWQKNTPANYPDWIPRAPMKAEDGRTVNYLMVNDERSLLYLVNQGTVTFHPWFSTVDDPNRPNEVLFDVDPHQSTFANAVIVAKTLRKVLEAEGVEPGVKTSGKSGLHVTTPWTGRGGYDDARRWAWGVAETVIREIPKIATMERTISKRGRRVYLDVEQNARGKHGVPPWVVRATPLATVSMPLDWKELTARLSPKKFTIKAALRRMTLASA